MSDTVLAPANSKTPEEDTERLWALTLSRVSDDGRSVSDMMRKMGVDVALRASTLSREAVNARDEGAKKLLHELLTTSKDPVRVTARINSLFAHRELTNDKGKKISLVSLDKALRSLNSFKGGMEPIDHSSRALYSQSRARLKTLFELKSKYFLEIDRKPLVLEDDDRLELHTAIDTLVRRHPDRQAAIVSIIRDRRITDMRRVSEMLEVTTANALMDGAL